MDAGAAALIFGLIAVMGFAAIPESWRKAGGGLLIALTIAVISLDAIYLIAR